MFPFADAGARRRSPPPVTVGLIGLNVLVFLYELQVGGLGVLTGGGSFDISVFFFKWGFIPSELAEGRDYQLLASGTDIASLVPTWATVFSSMFLHGGFLHLAGNMLFLWVFGRSMEDNLGPVRFLLLYFATGVAATLAHMAINPQSQAPLIGGQRGGFRRVGRIPADLPVQPHTRAHCYVLHHSDRSVGGVAAGRLVHLADIPGADFSGVVQHGQHRILRARRRVRRRASAGRHWPRNHPSAGAAAALPRGLQ